jgi:hypothetical protein
MTLADYPIIRIHIKNMEFSVAHLWSNQKRVAKEISKNFESRSFRILLLLSTQKACIGHLDAE